MSAALIESLRDRLEGVHAQYHLHFAGQSRLTRNAEMMRMMIEQAGAIETEAKGLNLKADPSLQALLELCEERLSLYRSELTQIQRAQTEAGPHGIEAAWHGTRANFVISRYRRDFAGENRGTRDLGLLAEMIADLDAIQAEMIELSTVYGGGSLADDLGVVGEYLEMFRAEQQEIASARDAGSLDDQASNLAGFANSQFELYRLHFAGQARVSRRPELLERMVNNLTSTLERMKGLQSNGLHVQYNSDNIAVVEERLGLWREELTAIRDVRSQTPLLTMVENLSEAAEAVLEIYNEQFAGQGRESRDLQLLGALCDRLTELERQMNRLARVQPLTQNERNLEMTRDAIIMLSEEWEEVAKAKAAAAN